MHGTNIIEVSEATFDQDVIDRSFKTTVVVDFWAPWCGPCRTLGPILERLAKEPGSDFVLAKVNVDHNQPLAMQYQVQGIPAVKAFRNGEMVGEFSGARPEPQVRAFLKRVAPSADAQQLDIAQNLLDQQRWAEAEEHFRRLPHSPQVALGLAGALLGQGKGCEAQEYLAAATDAAVYSRAEALQPLADFLCSSEEFDPLQDGVSTIEAQYRRVADLLRRGQVAAALDGLLDVLRQDRHYDDGQAKTVALSIFALLGDDDPLTQQYRPQLAMVIF